MTKTEKTRMENFQPLTYGGVSADPVGNTFRGSNEEIQVEPQVMRLFVYFYQNQGQTLTRQNLLDHCWDQNFVSDEALTQVISKLRKTLKQAGMESPCLKTVSRSGYQLVPLPNIPKKNLNPSRGHFKTFFWPGLVALLVLGFALYLTFFNTQEGIEDMIDEEAVEEALEDALKDQ